jgi:acetyl-CoA C-acetyltransferase
MSEEKAKSLGLKPLAKIIAQTSFAQEPEWFTTAPAFAIRNVLNKAGMTKEDIDLFEINEAFAVQALAVIKTENLDMSKVNVNGGAVALGHPIGASGARILTTLINTLEHKGGKFGIATLCIGGGEASALLIERL